MYKEPVSYFPEEIRKKYGLGEFSDAAKKNAAKKTAAKKATAKKAPAKKK